VPPLTSPSQTKNYWKKLKTKCPPLHKTNNILITTTKNKYISKAYTNKKHQQKTNKQQTTKTKTNKEHNK